MKKTLVITAPIVILTLTAIGILSNIYYDHVGIRPKYETSKSHVKDFKYDALYAVPFYLMVNISYSKDGHNMHVKYTCIQIFGLFITGRYDEYEL